MRVCLCLCVLLSLIAVVVAEENVLLNPGFEEGGSHGWYAWQTLRFSKVIQEPESAHSGEHYLDLQLDHDQDVGGYVQNAWGLLSWGDSLSATAWVRTDDLRGQHAFLKVEFFDEDWANCGMIESRRLTGTTHWTELVVTGTVPTRAESPYLDKINVVLCIDGRKNSGNAYFDDVRVGKKPPGEDEAVRPEE